MKFTPHDYFLDGNTEYSPKQSYDLPEHKAKTFAGAGLGSITADAPKVPKNKMMPDSLGNDPAAPSSALPAAQVSTQQTVVTSNAGGKHHQTGKRR